MGLRIKQKESLSILIIIHLESNKKKQNSTPEILQLEVNKNANIKENILELYKLRKNIFLFINSFMLPCV